MKALAILMIILSIGFTSCKSPTQAKSTTETVPNPNKKTTTSTDKGDEIYDIIISFISMGEGIKSELKNKIDKIITSFNEENKTEITPKLARWGREGEVDYNFSLKNLSTKQKKAFIGEIKEAIGSSEMALIKYNQKFVHKR